MLARRVESESELSRASRDTLTSLSFFKINFFVTRAKKRRRKGGTVLTLMYFLKFTLPLT